MAEQQEFVRSLEQASYEMIKEATKNMEKVCLAVECDAKKNVPVDNGTLRASISHDTQVTSEMIIGKVFSNLDYAPYIEKGTGIYAEEGNGRMTPWYVPEEVLQGGHKLPTFQGNVTPVYGKSGKKYYKTDGMKPQPFLEPARDENKKRITRILAGKSK